MTFARETDPMLRRFERNQALVCALMSAIAAVAGRVDIAAGVVGGTLLMVIGYAGIKAIVNVLTEKAIRGKQAENSGSRSRRGAWALVKFVTSYALLALAAYVMLVHLHLHPLGVVLGASTTVISVAIEGVGIARRLSRAGQPK